MAKILTLYLSEVINMKLFIILSIHYPANSKWENPNLSGRSCYFELTPNSPNLFSRNCIKAEGENWQLDFSFSIKTPLKVCSIFSNPKLVFFCQRTEDTYQGFIRVNMNLLRPIHIVEGERPLSIFQTAVKSKDDDDLNQKVIVIILS